MNVVLENMTDGVKLFDAARRIIYANSAADRLFGFEPGATQVGMTAEEILRRREEIGYAMVENGRPITFEERLDRLTHPTGERYERIAPGGHHLEFSFRTVGDGLTLGVYRDITELRRQQAESERAREAAEAANRAKSAFLATMSHEIRTPMNGVMGTAELLELEPLTPDQKRLVRTIQISATGLLGILDDVLDFSKIEADRLELEVAPFSLRGLVKGTVETFLAQADRKGLMVTASVAPEVPDMLLGDVTRVRQILLNLVGNALKFTESGAIEVQANLRSTEADKVRLDLSVTDTGIGMTAEQIERLFQPFAQGDSTTTRRYGGTGRRTPIVALTANALKGEDERAMAAGLDGYLTKPLTLRRLQETLNRWVVTRTGAPSVPRMESAPPTDAEPPIDRVALGEMLGGDRALIDNVLRHFAEVGARLVADIRAAAADPTELKRLAHKLKGTARAAGALRLGDLAAVFEGSLKMADIATLEGEWRRVAQHLGN